MTVILTVKNTPSVSADRDFRVARSALGRLRKDNPGIDPGDERIRRAEAHLQACRLAVYARALAESWPPLTPEQRADIAALLRPVLLGGDV